MNWKIDIVTKTIIITFIFLSIPYLNTSTETTVKADDSDNTLSILPLSITQENSSNITLSIFCEPIEPVAGWVLNINYDKKSMRLLSIEEGDFFTKQGYSTFFVEGTENDGVVESTYCITIGANSTNSSGYLCNFTFEPRILNGTTPVWLSLPETEESFLLNTTAYINSTTENSSITFNIPQPDINITVFLTNYMSQNYLLGTDINSDGKVNYLDRSIIKNWNN